MFLSLARLLLDMSWRELRGYIFGNEGREIFLCAYKKEWWMKKWNR